MEKTVVLWKQLWNYGEDYGTIPKTLDLIYYGKSYGTVEKKTMALL